ncbi:hypothetical protein [Mesorhizobium captivum]|nr:hypothetical protein [Mesorhizobium sp. VK23E]MDX8514419.1 hypothetical protein [Mesorhizobium sp. VK23E]
MPVWNDFFLFLVLITRDNLKTLAALPTTLVCIVLSKPFISGITHGAVK